MRFTKIFDIILISLSWFFTALTLAVLLFIILHIVSNGLPYLTPTLFEIHYTTQNLSMFPAIISTLAIVVLTLIFTVPLGVFTGIYLVEYVKKGSKFVMLVRSTSELLAGIPSIVFGLFGLLFFVVYMGLSFSLLAGSLTLSIMVLPSVIRTTEEALKSVSDGYREGAFALGAGKLRAVFRIVLPSAMPGIFAGIMLAIGRIIGESAALIFTAGTVAQLPESFSHSVRTLTVHMWILSQEGLHVNEAYATGVILLLLVLIINTVSAFFARKIAKG